MIPTINNLDKLYSEHDAFQNLALQSIDPTRTYHFTNCVLTAYGVINDSTIYFRVKFIFKLSVWTALILL